MVPAFDENGLLPAGEHRCTLAEARAALCFNPHRAALFENLERFLHEQVAPLNLNCPIYIDGSFVRSKSTPEDIDLVIDATNVHDDEKLRQLLLFRFRADDLKREYHVDYWFRHPAIPNDLVAFFQYAGPKAAAELSIHATTAKGILRIEL